jgi:hypothetical protein
VKAEFEIIKWWALEQSVLIIMNQNLGGCREACGRKLEL